jgi:glutamine amidotransferase
MNLLFSDSERLFGYRDRHDSNGLCVTRRTAPFDTVSLRNDDWEIDLAQEKRPDQCGYVIATRPPTYEKWTDITPGSLVVFKDGECVDGA